MTIHRIINDLKNNSARYDILHPRIHTVMKLIGIGNFFYLKGSDTWEKCKFNFKFYKTLIYRLDKSYNVKFNDRLQNVGNFDDLFIDKNSKKPKQKNLDLDKSLVGYIEFELDKTGFFKIDNIIYHWSRFSNSISNNYIFAGFKYKNPHTSMISNWTTELFGIDNNNLMSANCNKWIHPIIPFKIRFYINKI